MPYKNSPNVSEIKFLFKEIIDRIIIADIDHLRNIKPSAKFRVKCTIPLVLYIFSCMEFLGHLLVDDKHLKGRGSTQYKIWEYMQMTFGPDLDLFIEHKEIFVEKFRNKLT